MGGSFSDRLLKRFATVAAGKATAVKNALQRGMK